jgi:hypothetical protein
MGSLQIGNRERRRCVPCLPYRPMRGVNDRPVAVLEDALSSSRQADQGRRQGQALIWLWRAFSYAGVLSFIAVMWIQSWHAVSYGVMLASAAWAVLALWVPTVRMFLRKHERSRALHNGLDVCIACWSIRALRPDDQHCSECGAPRACPACKHRIKSDQFACPECGRAVWGRLPRETNR